MTNWDYYYMHKPTNTKDLYPDPYGALEDLLLEKRIRRIARAFTTVIALIGVSLTYATYPEWVEFFNF